MEGLRGAEWVRTSLGRVSSSARRVCHRANLCKEHPSLYGRGEYSWKEEAVREKEWKTYADALLETCELEFCAETGAEEEEEEAACGSLSRLKREVLRSRRLVGFVIQEDTRGLTRK